MSPCDFVLRFQEANDVKNFCKHTGHLRISLKMCLFTSLPILKIGYNNLIYL